MSDETAKPATLNSVEQRVVNLFADGVRVAGLPKSIGEIYGLLYISRHPLALDDLVVRLGISKGSASQGLKMLRTLGAIREVEGVDSRRTYFQADVNLKKLVGGFIREQVSPHLKSGGSKLASLEELAGEEPDPGLREFYEERVRRMSYWLKQARIVFPLLLRVLGK